MFADRFWLFMRHLVICISIDHEIGIMFFLSMSSLMKFICNVSVKFK